MDKFVAVAGNIGVGKTTLVQKLCDNLDWTPFFEPERENPYLADFYKDCLLYTSPSPRDRS